MAPVSSPTIPEGLDLLDTPDGTVIRKRWFSWAVIPMGIFATVWDSFVIFFYGKILHSPHVHWMMVVFPLGHLAVGVAITYGVFTMLFNRTDVRISPSGVRVWMGPLPCFGNKQVDRSEMNEIMVRTRASNRGSSTYSVMYVDSQRKERTLLAGMPQSDQAGFLAMLIRQRMGLPAAN